MSGLNVQRPEGSLIPDASLPQHRMNSTGHRVFPKGSHDASQHVFKAEPAVMDPQLDGHPSLGTTIMAVSYAGGVVLAADSRTSSGSFVVDRSANKLTPVTDNIYCCRSGSAADTQFLAQRIRNLLHKKAQAEGTPLTPVVTAANVFQTFCYKYRWQLSASIIVGGYDDVNGGQVFSVPSGGCAVRQDYAIGGSGSVFLYAWMDSNYRPGMTEEQCIAFCRQAVSHALSRDGSSGGLIRTISINKNGSQHTTTEWKDIPYCMEKDPQYAPMAKQNVLWASSSRVSDNQTDSTQVSAV